MRSGQGRLRAEEAVMDEPLTPFQIEERMRRVSRRLLAAIDEHKTAAETLGESKADYHRKYHEAHISSMVDHPDRKVGGHESYAQLQAADEYRAMVVAEEVEKSLRNEMHSLRQVLSALQTHHKHVGELAR